MSSQITISPSKRAAGRFISRVRRALQKALAEEAKKNGLTQSDVARAIGVDRSVIHRELRGHKDITLGRIGELAWAIGRKPEFELTLPSEAEGRNIDNRQVMTNGNDKDKLIRPQNDAISVKETFT